ncbi:cell wall-associated NlpC family hydrolase [Brevundimonas alba]|uniref:Cell wall-associated NlpC family hydrolase n=1 Tax=Brevundimonas alba TaxID=74314 RepID=A0A7X5YJI2_9CAUL|nr:NlpC/P60 family protein [Brevundimonas alba]NJC41111.1 cell wall-associated NlpC family hydrolase [Brevundimonas alba]
MTPDAASTDPRTTLARPDLAEQALEGLVRADSYLPARPMHAAVPVADLHAGAAPASERIDQLLFGEAFDVLDQQGDRLWGRARRDGMVGWVSASALRPGAPRPSHRVTAIDAPLPLNALVAEGDLPASDLSPVGAFESDPVAVAERLLGVRHSLGARSSAATDCSGLIQQALYACGLAGPRHSDQQAELGVAVERDTAGRGDLVIWLAEPGEHSWTGHSAFMLDTDRVLHATGHHGAVVIESFAEADARYRADGFHAPVFRRLQA